MSFNSLTTPVTIMFIINGFLHLHHSINLKKKFPKKHNFLTSFCTFLLWIVGGLLYPILYPSGEEYLLLQTISNVIIVFLMPVGIILALTIEYLVTKKRPEIMKYRGVEGFLKRFKENEERLKLLGKDLHRKALHFIPPALILLLLLMSHQYSKELGISLMLTVGYAGVIFISTMDFVRSTYIYDNKRIDHLLPKGISKILEKTMKRREIYESIKVVPLILGLLPSLFFPLSIFLSVMLIATLSDGAASVFGHMLGRINFPKKSSKTIMGYIAGAAMSFMLVLTICTLLEPSWSMTKIITLSFTGMLTFFAIDIVNSRIDDNVLNPLLTGLTLGVVYLII